MQPSRWQSVRSGFWECEVWWSDGRVVGHQRCAGWLQGLSFLVMCREVVWHRRCAGCVVGECGIGGVVDAVGIGGFCRRVFVDF